MGEMRRKKETGDSCGRATADGIFGDQENTSGSAGRSGGWRWNTGREENTSGDGGQDEDGNGNPEGEEEKDGELTEKNPEDGNKEG